jgi:hypothetical protein
MLSLFREFLTRFSVLPLIQNVDSDATVKIGTTKMSQVNRTRIKYFGAFSFHNARIRKSSSKLGSSSASARYSSNSNFMSSKIFLMRIKYFKLALVSLTLLLVQELFLLNQQMCYLKL